MKSSIPYDRVGIAARHSSAARRLILFSEVAASWQWRFCYVHKILAYHIPTLRQLSSNDIAAIIVLAENSPEEPLEFI